MALEPCRGNDTEGPRFARNHKSVAYKWGRCSPKCIGFHIVAFVEQVFDEDGKIKPIPAHSCAQIEQIVITNFDGIASH